jgi:hypothetical protein
MSQLAQVMTSHKPRLTEVATTTPSKIGTPPAGSDQSMRIT